MKPPPPQPDAAAPSGPPEPADPYQGFSLRRVTWGYRDVFEKTIEALFREGRLGPERQAVTTGFFDLLKRADQCCYDHVLHQFLKALNPQNRWILDLPAVFSDLTELGASLAERKLHYGIRFFETLAEGGMGRTPGQVRECLAWVRRLRDTDDALALAFLQGFRPLRSRLRPPELERYVAVALEIFARNPDSACAFLRGELTTSETYILQLTQECRLADAKPALAAMLQALTGSEYELEDLSGLDSDDLLERGTQVVSLEGHLYLPARVRLFDRAGLNRAWYMLAALAAAALALADAFPRVHGRPGYGSSSDLAGPEPWRQNLFAILEYIRSLRAMERRWPGARRLLAFGLGQESQRLPPGPAGPDHLLRDALDPAADTPALRALRRFADDLVNCLDTAQRLGQVPREGLLAAYPALDRRLLQPPGFLSDFGFPTSFSTTPDDHLVADLASAARRRRQERDAPDRLLAREQAEGDGDPEPNPPDETPPDAAYVYDEWDFQQNDYRPGWCRVRLMPVPAAAAAPPCAPPRDQLLAVRSVFERLRPTLTRREKYLEHGDAINEDRLIEHVVERRRQPCPPIRFYDKPRIKRRDLATLILLDVSGSTGNPLAGQTRTLDLEQQAALLLGAGLAALDDRFAIGGFSSNGRESCFYYLFKAFDNPWNDAARARVGAAWPGSSTRIGPALRHSGWLLAAQPCRQRLILLITDGKPTDQGYDPDTGYAQRDVRMACEENARRDIHTFAISTTENSLSDMDLMFPRRRFLILDDIRRLPALLPRLYLQLTL